MKCCRLVRKPGKKQRWVEEEKPYYGPTRPTQPTKYTMATLATEPTRPTGYKKPGPPKPAPPAVEDPPLRVLY